MLARKSLVAFGGVLALLVLACGPAATATVAPTPTPVAAATPTPARPGITPQPTPTLQPTPIPTRAPTPTAAGPKYGGTLKYVRRGEDPSWDMMKYTGGGGELRPMAHTVFSRLASWAGAQPKPCERGINPLLAESWKWVGDTTFEVKIRQGAKFHNKPPVNGREVTAEDVAYSYRRGMFVWPVRAIKAVADNVVDVVAKDRYTVQFRTKAPLGMLPETLNWYFSLVVLAKESGGPAELWEDPTTSWIGSGPFMFERHFPGLKTVLVRNPDYFEKGFPYLDGVEQVIVPDVSTVQSGIRAGRLDLWDWNVSLLSVKAIQQTAPQIQVQECPGLIGNAPGFLYFKMDEPVWQDVRVRRAALMAVDRKVLVDTALLGRGVGMYPYAPSSPLFTKKEDLSPEAQKYVTYNPDEARRLLREAGYAEGKGPEFNIVFTTAYGLGSPYAVAAEAMEKMFREVGFRVKMDWQDMGRYNSGFITGRWSEGAHAGVAIWSAIDSSSLTRFHSKATIADNKGRVRDPEYDALVDKFMVTVDQDKQRELTKAIQSRIVEQAFGIPGAVGLDYAMWQPWVKNFTFVFYNVPRPLTYAWLDK